MANAKQVLEIGDMMANMINNLSATWVTDSVTLVNGVWDRFGDSDISEDDWEKMAAQCVKKCENPDTFKSRKSEYKKLVYSAAYDYTGAVAAYKKKYKKMPSREIAKTISRVLPRLGCGDFDAVFAEALEVDKKQKEKAVAKKASRKASPEQVLLAAFKTIRETETTNRAVIEWRAKHGASVRKLVESLTAE